jgi:hypothetical protein
MSFNPNTKASQKFSYYPPGLYYALANVAHDHDISIKEVETVLIRDALTKEYGFKCNHPQSKIKTAKRTGKSYCSWCWTRLEVIRAPIFGKFHMLVTPGLYKPIKAFNEPEIKKEDLGQLLPDLR